MNTRKIHFIWFTLLIVVVNLGAAPAASLPALVEDNGFGYTWDLIPNSVPARWASIATPENKLVFTNLTGGWSTISSGNFLTGGMKFFDERVSTMWVSVNGLIGFGEAQSEPDNTFIPYEPLPNSIVAGFWTDLTMEEEDVVGGIYYQRFVGAARPIVCTSATGTAASTNECAIIQWDQVLEDGGEGRRNTFQIVLYDTGEIHLLFQDLQTVPTLATVGLEAGDGVYGAQSFYNDSLGVISGDEIVYYYPQPRLRHKALSLYQSELLARNGGFLERTFTVTVTNNGDLSSQTSDIYEAAVEYTSQPDGWNAEILLSDTNGVAGKDTGSINQTQSRDVQVKVTAPLTSEVGNTLDAKIVFTSATDGSQQSEARIVAAYSAPFAQIVHNKDLYLRTMWDQHQADRVINQAFTGTNMSLAQVQGTSFFVAWEKAVNNSTDIEYAFVGALGTGFPRVFKVTQNSENPSVPQDLFPAVGIGPDGRPVYAYIRVEEDLEGPGIIFNVRLTILDSSGRTTCPIFDFDESDPCNIKESITENTLSDLDLGGPIYENPRLAITSEGKYVIAWTKSVEIGEITSRKIEMAVVNPDGSIALEPAPIFESSTNDFGYYETALTRFNGTNVLAVAVKRDEAKVAYQVVYKIINSANGSVVVSETVLGTAGNPPAPDAVQLPTGEGVIAWKNKLADISYAMIDSAGVVKTGLSPLIMPNTRPMQAVSVTTEPHGNAVLTWTDTEDDYLYYALLNRDGVILTPPMVIAQDTNGGPVLSSRLGYGNAFFEGKAFTYLPLLSR